MRKYTKIYNPNKTSQKEAIPGRENEMAENYAGGVVFKLDKWKTLDRFLILGSDAPTYYAGAQKLTKENAKNITVLIKEDAKRVVDVIVDVSDTGRAPNNDPALFALAMVAGLADDEGKKYALENLSKVARIGTHLFHFVEYVEAFRGWGRGLRNGIAKWYTEKAVDKLAFQVVKYQSRDGWSHRDVLRKTHARAAGDEMNSVFAWVTHGIGGEMRQGKSGDVVKTFPHNIDDMKTIDIIYAFELAKKATSEKEIVDLINKYNLPREAVPTNFMGKEVYGALMPKMGLTALIRNLGNLSKVGILEAGNFDEIAVAVDKITNEKGLHKARVHPIQILMALKTYGQGHGFKGSSTWNVVPQIIDALNKAFYLSFKNIVPSGKRILIALDVSGSMGMYKLQSNPLISAREGSALMAMVTARTEKRYTVVGFTGSGNGMWGRNQDIKDLSLLTISPDQTYEEIVRTISGLPMGGTDCALPALWAKANKKDYDAIFIYTDNETWAGTIQPVQAMKAYRKQVGHDVKMVVVAMTSTGFTIADPTDPSMLDVVGFDTNAPAVMSDFVSGKL